MQQLFLHYSHVLCQYFYCSLSLPPFFSATETTKKKKRIQSKAMLTLHMSSRYDHMKNCRPCNYNEEVLQEFLYLLMQFSSLVQSEAKTALLLICKFSLSPGSISHFILGNKGKIQLGSLFKANDSLQITHWVCSLYY